MLPSHRKAFETLFKTYGYVGMLELLAKRASDLGCMNTATDILACRDKLTYMEDAK